MQIIADYLEGKEVWHNVKDVDSSGRYGAPYNFISAAAEIKLYLSKVLYYDPLYDEVEAPFAENWDTETNRRVLLKAIRQQKNHVMLYLMSGGVSTADGITVAIQSNNLGAFKHLHTGGEVDVIPVLKQMKSDSPVSPLLVQCFKKNWVDLTITFSWLCLTQNQKLFNEIQTYI